MTEIPSDGMRPTKYANTKSDIARHICMGTGINFSTKAYMSGAGIERGRLYVKVYLAT